MANHTFITGQFVRIGQKLANANSRVSAFLIDLLVIFFLFLFEYVCISMFMMSYEMEDVFTILLYVGISLNITYPLWMEWLFKGQTLGKMAMGIRVVGSDGSTPSFVNLFFRWIFLLVESMSGFGVVVMLFTKNNQRLGDLAGGTYVVKTRKSFFGRTYRPENFMPGYKPVFPQAALLSEVQMEVLTEAFYLNSHNAEEIRVQLCKKICDFLKINVSNMTTHQFLGQIHYDYRYLAVHAE